MATQTDIQNAVNTLINETTGKYIGANDGRAFQLSIAPVCQLFTLLNVPLPEIANNWLNVHATSEHYKTVEYQEDKDYPIGSIYIWDSPHMAIALSPQMGNFVNVYEQGADPDGSPCGTKTREIDNDNRLCTHVLLWNLEEAPVLPTVTHSLPQGALPVPIVMTPYELVVTLKGYGYATWAKEGREPILDLQPGNWFIIRSDTKYPEVKKITQGPGQHAYWIDSTLNKLPDPEPVVEKQTNWVGPREASPVEPMIQPMEVAPIAPVVEIPVVKSYRPSEVPVGDTDDDPDWKQTYKQFYSDGRSKMFRLENSTKLREYAGIRTGSGKLVMAGTVISSTGYFMKNGNKFYRVRSPRDEFYKWYYAFPMYDDDGNANLVAAVEPEQPRFSLLDVALNAADDLRHWWDIKRKKVSK